MFNRKSYKKDGAERSKGLAKKMLPVSLVSILAVLAVYIPLFILQKKFYFKAQLVFLSVGFFISVMAVFLSFTLTRYVFNYRKSGELAFNSFKNDFSFTF